jgi:uracil-DNA glycosylase
LGCVDSVIAHQFLANRERALREFATGVGAKADIGAPPHPSWRNTAWLKRHPWFEADALPVLQKRIATLL